MPRCPAAHPPARRSPATSALLLALVLALLATSCSDAYTDEEKERAEGGSNPRFLTVYVVPAVATAFEELVDLYELENPSISFLTISGESPSLADNIDEGADPSLWVDTTKAQASFADSVRVTGPSVPFGYDVLEVVAPDGNPRQVNSVGVFGPQASLVLTALCEESTLCGKASRAMLLELGIEPSPDVIEEDGESLVAAVATYRVDVGIAFRTDVVDAPRPVDIVPVPVDDPGRIDFAMMPFSRSSTVSDFTEWVTTSPVAREVLVRRGLLPVDGS